MSEYNISISRKESLSDKELEKANTHIEILSRRLNNNAEYNQKEYAKMILKENAIDDYLISYNNIRYYSNDDEVGIILENVSYVLDDNAVSQLCAKLNVPIKYINSLLSERSKWAYDLIANIFHNHGYNKRYHDLALIRIVDNRCMAVLSNQYDRYSTVDVFNKIVTEVKDKVYITKVGYDGYTTYLEITRKDIIPIRFNNDIHFYVFGAHIRNSSFGRSAFEIKPFVVQVVCNNGLTRERVLYQTHMSDKMTNIGYLSKESLIKRSELKIHYAKDALDFILSDNIINEEIDRLTKLSNTFIDSNKQIQKLKSTNKLQADEAKAILDIINNGESESGLLNNGSAYDLIQAITRHSQTQSLERRSQLNDLAGSIVIAP